MRDWSKTKAKRVIELRQPASSITHSKIHFLLSTPPTLQKLATSTQPTLSEAWLITLARFTLINLSIYRDLLAFNPSGENLLSLSLFWLKSPVNLTTEENWAQ